MRRWAVAVLLTVFWSMNAPAETMRVGIKPVPPFAMADDHGGWTGISVELWQRIAAGIGWQTEWVPMDSTGDQIEALAEGRIDAAAGALSMTPEREVMVNFSHPFYSTDLAIATVTHRGGWLAIAQRLVSPAFLSAVGVLVLLLLAVGALLWLAERKHNAAQFGGSAAKGIGNGFWWSAVTMTTVGYGDKAPQTAVGRLLATVWMFVSVITISSFTAAIASSFTLAQLSTAVSGVNDLGRVRCVSVTGSTGEQFLHKRGIRTVAAENPAAAIALLRQGEADALVYDEPILRYLLKDAEPGIEILPQSIERQYYAFALKPGFTGIETLNRALLADIAGDEWQEMLFRYLGQR